MQWYLKVLRQYADFSGRARRTEYWMFTLFNFIAMIVLVLIDQVLGTGFLAFVYVLAVLLPSLAVAARRLHDIGRGGWWQLIGFIPLIGAIIMIVWCVTEGQPQPNQWGPNPKAVQASGGAAVAY
jgi:uncharacterized membrane protein YhaH (DUF805 family)